MTRLRGLLLAALVAPCLATPAHAATPELVLRGSRTASTVLVLTRSVTLVDRPPDGGAGAKVTGKGDLFGYYVADMSGRVLLANVDSTRVHWSRLLTLGRQSSTPTLRPGRYVLTLVANGETEVRVPAPGLARTAVYRPTTPVPVRITDQPLAGGAGGLTMSAAGRAPVPVGPRTLVWLGVAVRYSGFGDDTVICLAPRGGDCPGHAEFSSSRYLVGVPDVDKADGAALFVLPGALPRGTLDAVWEIDLRGVATEVRGVAIAIG